MTSIILAFSTDLIKRGISGKRKYFHSYFKYDQCDW